MLAWSCGLWTIIACTFVENDPELLHLTNAAFISKYPSTGVQYRVSVACNITLWDSSTSNMCPISRTTHHQAILACTIHYSKSNLRGDILLWLNMCMTLNDELYIFSGLISSWCIHSCYSKVVSSRKDERVHVSIWQWQTQSTSISKICPWALQL